MIISKFQIGVLLFFTTIAVKSQVVQVAFNTSLGTIIAELYPEQAPITCANFINYIKNNELEGAHFYRVVTMDNQPNNDIKIEVIQGGLGFDNTTSPFPAILHETTKETGVLHVDGALSMARLEPGTATSEFFICVGNQPELDFGGKRNNDGQGFAAFGKVINGMEIVRKIQQLPNKEQMLLNTVTIHSIKLID